MPSDGECVPLVTSPIGSPPSSTIGSPWRGTAFSVIRKATRRRFGPSSFVRRRTSTPVNSFCSAQVQPRPASIALVSGVMSLPCSG